MSWQSYVDDHLMCDVDGVHLAAAAIIGQDGSVWAQSSTFPQFKPEEISNIVKDFDEPGFLAPAGLFLGGTKYMVIQGEPGAVIRGKKQAQKLSPEWPPYASGNSWQCALVACNDSSLGILTCKLPDLSPVFFCFENCLSDPYPER